MRQISNNVTQNKKYLVEKQRLAKRGTEDRKDRTTVKIQEERRIRDCYRKKNERVGKKLNIKGTVSLDQSGLKVVLVHQPTKEQIAAFACYKQCRLCFVISRENYIKNQT